MIKWSRTRPLTPQISVPSWFLTRVLAGGTYGAKFSGSSGTEEPHRFLGTDPEPRPALPSGHIPGSFSLPFDTFLERRTGADGLTYSTFLPQEGIRTALERAVGPQRLEIIISGKVPVITTCGSGMTAGVIWLGLKLLGVNNCSLYDEVNISQTKQSLHLTISKSWTGYALRSQSKIEKSI